MKKYIYFILSVFILSFLSCEKNFIKEDGDGDDTNDDSNQSESMYDGVDEDEDDYILDFTCIKQITLNGSSVTADTGGITVSGTTVTITSPGTYNVTGSLDNGQIIVNTEDEGDIKIILDNVDITCLSSAPIYVASADKVIIILADGSENFITDGASYSDLVDGEPNAAIFAKSDLTLYGEGSLTVNGNYNDGITSKDGLIIKSGTYSITAADDGIRGKDYLIVYDGDITIDAGGDGLKSDNDSDTEAGFIAIKMGIFTISSSGDAISAYTDVEVTNGEFNITSGGGSNRTSSSSAKGIKGLVSLTIEGGVVNVNSADDGLHSDGSVTITGGTVGIASGDDGIHADNSISITDADVSVSESYEGIESASITCTNSNVRLVSEDDGFNATQGTRTENNDNSCLTVNSGYVYINSSGGDALDSNGNIVINGGTIIVHGPLSSPEVGMDYNGTCKVSGGTLIVSGTNSNMTEAPSTSSTQYSVLIKFSSSLFANTIVHIEDSEGNDVMTFAPVRSFQSLCLSSPDLKSGGTYTIYTGGSYSGTETDGLYTDGTYTAGTSYGTFTISGIVTTVGTSSNNGGPGGRP
jgi:hypothetical protein